ncbi:tetratricopeptide repeat protein [bacterium]|nr:tetratricopeptide repeat protein [bacterium]
MLPGKFRWKLLAILILTLALLSCSKKREETEQHSSVWVVGTWVKTTEDAEIPILILKLKPDSTFGADMIDDDELEVYGTYSVKGNVMTFTDKGGDYACLNKQGIYEVLGFEDELILKLLEDPCAGRGEQMKGTWINLQRYQREIDRFTLLIQNNPLNAAFYENRATYRGLFLKDLDGAMEDYNKAIELNPNFAQAYFNRGLARYSIQDKEGACQDWHTALELGFSEREGVEGFVATYCE